MKKTALSYITLTLFMLVVVMLSAFFFMYQSWRNVADKAALAEVAIATRDAAEAQLATAVNDVEALDAQLFTSQQEVERLDADLAAAQTTLAQFAAQSQDEATRILIVNPQNNAQLTVGEPIDVIAVVIDAAGISSVELTMGDEVRRLPVNDTPVYIARETWVPATTGSMTVTVTAAMSDGRVTEPASIDITVEEAPQAVPLNAPSANVQQETPQEAAIAAVTLTDAETIPVGEPVSLVIFVADSVGITAVEVSIDGTTNNFVADGQTIAVFRTEWTPAEVGTFDVTVKAENVNGRFTTTNVLTITVSEDS
ncbi:MAG: hypothetical protein Kow0080_23460 [Candidatus Promineifilaceae bacterium]